MDKPNSDCFIGGVTIPPLPLTLKYVVVLMPIPVSFRGLWIDGIISKFMFNVGAYIAAIGWG